ncbi:GNAT family N-acetyltransferase [Streptosporangium fragile]|uniref:GNAT family N-acetyltransferase n=1 Tax=Streptosporangium fragile TaxID=46186 RepID=A0ABN3W2L6_9ACTN
MTVMMRRYGGAPDLRAMQELTQRLWSLASPHHVGDLAWGRFMYTPDQADWPIALWEDRGRVIAWGWAQFPDDLRLQVDPTYPRLLDEVLDWLDELAAGNPREINPLDSQKEVQTALLRRGYRRQESGPYFAYHMRDLADLPAVVLPEGFTARAVAGEADLNQRVAVHRAAWNSTRVTTDSYRAVMAAWPYRPNLDWIVAAPDGRSVANCLIWCDDANKVGLIEPVGTHPEFRRLGLSRAVCLAALHALKDVGATTAIVCPRGDPAYPIPQRLYRSLGFRPYDRTRTYTGAGRR